MHFDTLRDKMVDQQIMKRGISDSSVIEALRTVPRHLFVSLEKRWEAYEDHPLSIGYGQTISQPYIVALMTESLKLRFSDCILEIGTGSGYQTAILAQICDEVYTVERVEPLLVETRQRLDNMGYRNIHYCLNNDSICFEDGRREFDAIMVTAAAISPPQALFSNLTQKGRMIVPVGGAEGQILTLFTKEHDRILERRICSCLFVPLIGTFRWN